MTVSPETQRSTAGTSPSGERIERPAFAGRHALVTGASSGIGRAIAKALARGGASLTLIGRRPQKLREIAAKICLPSTQVSIHEVDLAKGAQIDALAARVKRDAHTLDLLIHSAGVIGLGSVEHTSVAELDRQWQVNLRAPYLLTHALLPMLKSSRGEIVFVNSSAGLGPAANASHYAATKHALKGFADSLRQEVNADGVRVLSVFVGRTATPMQAFVHAGEGRRYAPEKLIQAEDVAAVVVHALRLPRSVEATAIHLRPMTRPD